MIQKNFYRIKKEIKKRDEELKKLDEEKLRIIKAFNEEWDKRFKAFQKYDDISIDLYNNVRIKNGLLITSFKQETILQIIKDLEPRRCEIEEMNHSWTLHIDMDAGFKGESYE